MTNFPNGSLVLRVWRFDGSGELLAKFAYFDDAKRFAAVCRDRDEERGANTDGKWFYLAVCESECAVQAYPRLTAVQSGLEG